MRSASAATASASRRRVSATLVGRFSAASRPAASCCAASRAAASCSASRWRSTADSSRSAWAAGLALLLGGLAAGLAQLLRGLLALGVGDGLVGDGVLAVAGLGLLELALLDQVVLAGHGTGDLLGLAGDAVEEPLAGLCCLVVAHGCPVPCAGEAETGSGCDLCRVRRPRGHTGRLDPHRRRQGRAHAPSRRTRAVSACTRAVSAGYSRRPRSISESASVSPTCGVQPQRVGPVGGGAAGPGRAVLPHRLDAEGAGDGAEVVALASPARR